MLAIFTCHTCQEPFNRDMTDLEISARQDLGQIPADCELDSMDLGEALCQACADEDLSNAHEAYRAWLREVGVV